MKKIEYVQELHLPPKGKWTDSMLLNPFHPLHGPLPDRYSLVKCDDEDFAVALWDTECAILIFLERLKEESAEKSAPKISISEAYKMGGWIAKTYRWNRRGDQVVCEDQRIDIPDYPGVEQEDDWVDDIYVLVMLGSVYLAAKSVPGFVKVAERLERLK